MSQMLKTRSGRVLVLPTEQEDAEILQGISTDPDTFNPTDQQLSKLQPIKRGRPFSVHTKERITIRLSSDVLQAFRSTGVGWQTRIDAALKEWLSSHS